VQAKLSQNLVQRRKFRLASDALLLGRIFDDRGNRMSPTYAIKKGVRYRYYVSAVIAQGLKSEAGSNPRVPASEIEKVVIDALRSRYPAATDESDRRLVEQYLVRGEVRTGILQIELASLGARTDPSQSQLAETISIPWSPPSPFRRREILLPPCTDAETTRPMKAEHKARLLRAIRNGFIWLGELVDLKVADTEALAQREGLSERNIRMTLSLAFLAPDIIVAALDGRLPRGLGLTRLTELPVSWAEQRRIIGIS
jgi:hypothetical protein